MFVGILQLDLLLPDHVNSLKDKRHYVRGLVAQLRRSQEVAAAEAGHLQLHRRALIGVAVVATEMGRCQQVLDSCERLVAAHPEFQMLSAHQRYVGDED